MKNNPIGVFDSGIGGLTVLKKLVSALPDENYLYFGDTARVPYGEKTKEQLLEFGREILDWFEINNVKAVLMACNTSSANTLHILKDEYNFPIFGLIKPTAKYTATLDLKRLGIIATSATIKSGAYSKAILEINPSIEVFEIACPGLVEIVEAGKSKSVEAKNLVSKFILPLLEKEVEKIILGCTHYPYLSNVINELTGNPDMLIDPAENIVRSAKEHLEKLDLINKFSGGSRKYFVSSNPEKFVETGKQFYSDLNDAQEISLILIRNL